MTPTFLNFLFAIAALTARVERDAYCYLPGNIPVGVVLAGTLVEVLEETETRSLIFSERHNAECWISNAAFEEPGFIHPDHLSDVMRWETLTDRWIDSFPNLTTELVLSVVYKETAGDPHATDRTGNDLRLVGAASVGLMGAIPRPHLPCYTTLTGPNGRNEYSCQLYLGMFILNSAIQQAHELRVGPTTPASIFEGVMTQDAVCRTHIRGGKDVAWLRTGEKVNAFKTAVNVEKVVSHARIYLERYSVYCWVAIEKLQRGQRPPPPPVVDETITEADVELGLQLYGCTLENVLNDNCLSWGGPTYTDLVLDIILPEIQAALEKP